MGSQLMGPRFMPITRYVMKRFLLSLLLPVVFSLNGFAETSEPDLASLTARIAALEARIDILEARASLAEQLALSDYLLMAQEPMEPAEFVFRKVLDMKRKLDNSEYFHLLSQFMTAYPDAEIHTLAFDHWYNAFNQIRRARDPNIDYSVYHAQYHRYLGKLILDERIRRLQIGRHLEGGNSTFLSKVFGDALLADGRRYQVFLPQSGRRLVIFMDNGRVESVEIRK